MSESKTGRWNSAKPNQSPRPRPRARREKIRVVRQQLLEGEYDLNERLDITLERVLENLISQKG